MNATIGRLTSVRGRGFTMLEVMVTLVILSFGLLGLAALIMTGVRLSHQSYLQTQAVLLAYDILDRIRANSRQCVVGCQYENSTSAPASPPDCLSSSCADPNDFATFDLARWHAALQRQLPNGRGAVCRGTLTVTPPSSFTCTVSASATDTRYAVSIVWVEQELNRRLDLSSDLRSDHL